MYVVFIYDCTDAHRCTKKALMDKCLYMTPLMIKCLRTTTPMHECQHIVIANTRYQNFEKMYRNTMEDFQFDPFRILLCSWAAAWKIDHSSRPAPNIVRTFIKNSCYRFLGFLLKNWAVNLHSLYSSPSTLTEWTTRRWTLVLFSFLKSSQSFYPVWSSSNRSKSFGPSNNYPPLQWDKEIKSIGPKAESQYFRSFFRPQIRSF